MLSLIRKWVSARRLAFAFGASACLLAVAAQAEAPMRITPQLEEEPNASAPNANPDAKEKVAREQELTRLRAEQRKAAETQLKLAAEVEAIGKDRRKLSTDLIETAARLRSVESRIGAAEARLEVLDENEAAIRKNLDERRGVIGELLAALQRMGRRPPPALMVRPEDALVAVRTAIMLGAVVPEMRNEVDALAADLAQFVHVRQQITEERAALAQDFASLSDERQRMTLLVEERQKRQAETEKALDSERQRAATLARQVDNLKDLIAKLDPSAVNTPATQDAKPSAPASGRNNAALLRDSSKLGPAIAFASAKRALPLPVNGVKLREFGTTDRLGGTEKGISIASRAAAQVTAPCDGWVVYAGPFRSYGQLLILNAGGGYHVLLAGMERISVDLGQFVLTGEPVAVMGGGPQMASAFAVGSNQPILYVEFRKDGIPVDPSPWWAITDSEKVRG
jgi:septal ring factor EnvC (AmiA/AmiB activator)